MLGNKDKLNPSTPFSFQMGSKQPTTSLSMPIIPTNNTPAMSFGTGTPFSFSARAQAPAMEGNALRSNQQQSSTPVPHFGQAPATDVSSSQGYDFSRSTTNNFNFSQNAANSSSSAATTQADISKRIFKKAARRKK